MKKVKHFFLFFLAVMVLGACTGNKEYRLFNEDDSDLVIKQTSDEAFEESTGFEWKIAKGDRVSITAYNQSASANQLNQLLSTGGETTTFTQRIGDEGVLIGNEGSILLPLVGKVKIAGLTEDQAAEKLIHEYKKYLRTPFVTVKLLGQKLFVLGEVKRPGTVIVTHGTMTLYEALATSGDLTDDAMRTNIKILRGDLRKPEVHEVDLTDMSTMRFASLMLRPNDVVYVQPRTMKAINKNFTEQMPFFELIAAILTPYVQLKVVQNLDDGDFF
jgi:polysaccharide export outer membrane protein